MMKLMKYELLRRKQLLIAAAISVVFVEGLVLLGIYNSGGWETFFDSGWNGWHALAIVMTVLLVVGLCILALLDAIIKVYSDFKHRHGCMIFMTPQSGYRIIWAKTIFAVLEVLAAGLVVAGCLALDAAALEGVYGDVISKTFGPLNIDAGIIIGCIALGALQIIAQLSIAILAVTVSRAMARGSNWFIALLMYFTLAVVVNMVNGWLLSVFGATGDFMRIVDETVVVNCGLFIKYFIISAVTYSAWFVGCTLISGRLVKRGIDL